MNQNASPLYP